MNLNVMLFSPLAVSLPVSGNGFPNIQALIPLLTCEIPNPGDSLLIVGRVLGEVLK